jgi:hypothetical protein
MKYIFGFMSLFLWLGSTLGMDNFPTVDDIRKFAPTLHFHESEQYFPCSIEHLLKGAVLKVKNDSEWQIDNPTQQNLKNYCYDNYYVTVNESQYSGSRQTAPLYYSIEQYADAVRINYFILYAFQGGQTARDLRAGTEFNCILHPFGEHQGDLERVVLTFYKGGNKNHQLYNIGYEEHGDATFFSPDQIAWDENHHPIVNVALNSHASYNGISYGNWFRTFGVPGVLDTIDLLQPIGDKWTPSEFKQLALDNSDNPLTDQLWARFAGRLGREEHYEVLKSATYIDGRNLNTLDWTSVDGWDFLAFCFRIYGNKVKYNDGPEGPYNRHGVKPAAGSFFNKTPAFYNSVQIGNQTTGGIPVLAVANNKFYLAYRDAVSSQIWFTISSDGKKWDDAKQVSNETCSFDMALAPYNNAKLFMAYRDAVSSQIYISVFDSSTWQPKRIDGQTTGGTPALLVYNDNLYLAYKDAVGSQIYVSKLDEGLNVKDTKAATNQTCADSVSLASYNGGLYMTYKDAVTSQIYVSKFDENLNFGEAKRIDGQTTSTAPALAVYKNLLLMAYKDAVSSQIYVSSYNGANWTNPLVCPWQTSSFGVSLASLNSDDGNSSVFMAYKDAVGPQIWFSQGQIGD